MGHTLTVSRVIEATQSWQRHVLDNAILLEDARNQNLKYFIVMLLIISFMRSLVFHGINLTDTFLISYLFKRPSTANKWIITWQSMSTRRHYHAHYPLGGKRQRDIDEPEPASSPLSGILEGHYF